MTTLRLLPAVLLALALGGPLSAKAPPPVPSREARETEWSAYVAQAIDTFDRVEVATETEHRLADDSRIDIFCHDGIWGESVRGSVAWEVERAEKWKEAIGQASYYHAMSGAMFGGVVLIVLDPVKDKVSVLRCSIACKRCGLWLWTVDAHGVIRKVGRNG